MPNAAVTRRHVIYLVVALLITAIAGVEIMHALPADESRDVLMCMAPQSKIEAFREMLLLHLYSH